MSHTNEISIPYAISFAAKSSCEWQSKTFERFVSNAPKVRPWSRDCPYFSNKLIKQCWALKPLLKPYWYFESIIKK